VAGEIVTLMFVVGSVQVDVELVLVVLAVGVVQVIAVLAGAAPQEVSARPATTASVGASSAPSNRRRRFTAPLLPLIEIRKARRPVSILSSRMQNNVPISNLEFQISH
jgi:hypothetical protein